MQHLEGCGIPSYIKDARFLKVKEKSGKMKEFVLYNNEYFSKLICLNHTYRLCKIYQTDLILLNL
jgi:hypothetical protein